MYIEMKVRDAIADIFVQEGIQKVFGHTGGHIMLLWDAIVNSGIEAVFNKQEGNAVYMADAFSRLSGLPSIVLGTSGPGIQNTVTGLASAYLDSIPIIAIGAGVPTWSAGRNALQESSARGRATDQLMIFKGCTKQATLAQTPQSIPRLIREAFRTVLCGRPGPVYIEIPEDYWDIEIEYEQVEPRKYKNLTIPKCDLRDCEAIAGELFKAKRPAIVIGEGALEEGIGGKFMKFIDTVQIPFYCSPKAKDFVDEFNKFCISGLRVHRKTPKEYGYLKTSDFVLFLGSRQSQWEINWEYERVFKDAKLAQIDPDPQEIGKVFSMDYSAVGSISSFIDYVGEKTHKNATHLIELAKKYNYKLHRPRRYEDSKIGIHPLNLSNITEELLPKQCVVVPDTGYTATMAINKFRTGFKQRFLISDYNSPMGWSLPASIGASLYSEDPVICLVGDGSFQMTSNELATLANYKRKVIFVIQNNQGCISIKNNMEGYYGKEGVFGPLVFENPDFVKLAQAFGFDGFCVNTSKDYEQILKKALESTKTTIIDVRIDQKLMDWE